MARFLIERNFAEEVNSSPEIATAINQVNMDVGVREGQGGGSSPLEPRSRSKHHRTSSRPLLAPSCF